MTAAMTWWGLMSMRGRRMAAIDAMTGELFGG
jgi:hypothetical protein